MFEIIDKYTESKNMVKAAKKIGNVYFNIAIHQECGEKFKGAFQFKEPGQNLVIKSQQS